MPYISQRRLICNRRWSAPAQSSAPTERCGLRARSGASRRKTGSTGLILASPAIASSVANHHEDHSQRGSSTPRRAFDGHRVIGLIERSDPAWSPEQLANAADVLRQMVYLPNTSLLVGLDGRMLVGVAVLALRPSVSAGGLIGNIDLLAVEAGREDEGVIEALLRELIRSARNKGCVLLEGNVPAEPADLARWEAQGFSESGPRLRCPLVRAAALSW